MVVEAYPVFDIGLAHMAMHSSYEVAGIEDIKALRAFAKAFYEDRIC